MSVNNFNLSINKSSTKGSYTVNLTGNLSVDNSVAIHKFLHYEALTQDVITVLVNDSDDIDLSTIQIIIGYLKARNKSKKETYIKLDLDKNLIELLNKSGSLALISSLQNKN
jgi:hypothetical protein